MNCCTCEDCRRAAPEILVARSPACLGNLVGFEVARARTQERAHVAKWFRDQAEFFRTKSLLERAQWADQAADFLESGTKSG